MFRRDERVLVAVSGGKDSLALWDVLVEDGYETSGLYLDLGIFEYSEESKARCRAFAEARGVPLIISTVAEKVGAPVPVIQQVTRRPPCSGCGLSKRYLMNRVALEQGFPVVATGHNLDDEAATLFGSVMHWQTEALPRQSPALASTHPKLVRRVKPLYRLSERETAAFAFMRRIDYIVEECPFAKGATSIAHKETLNRLEEASPGAKHNFLFGFLEKARPAFERAEQTELVECASCGQATTGPLCAFCKLAERVKAHAADPASTRRCRDDTRGDRRGGENRRGPEGRGARGDATGRPPRGYAHGARGADGDRCRGGRRRRDRLRRSGGRAGIQHRPQRRPHRRVPHRCVRHDPRPDVRLGTAGGQLRRHGRDGRAVRVRDCGWRREHDAGAHGLERNGPGRRAAVAAAAGALRHHPAGPLRRDDCRAVGPQAGGAR